MTQKNRERRPCQESAAHQPNIPDSHLTADEHGWRRPWSDVVNWWTRPDWSYRKGFEDGAKAAQEQLEAEHAAAVRHAFEFAVPEGLRPQARPVERHFAALQQQRRRAAFDRGEVTA